MQDGDWGLGIGEAQIYLMILTKSRRFMPEQRLNLYVQEQQVEYHQTA